MKLLQCLVLATFSFSYLSIASSPLYSKSCNSYCHTHIARSHERTFCLTVMSSIESETGLDYTHLLGDMQIAKPDAFNQALTILNAYDTGSSCARYAMVDLIDSCHDLEVASSANTNAQLDRIKSGFAARLAVCELDGAKIKIPKACSFLKTLKTCIKDPNPQRNAKQASSFCFESLKLSQCLKALASTSQSWTSYSNNHQNAISICHSVRHEVEMG